MSDSPDSALPRRTLPDALAPWMRLRGLFLMGLYSAALVASFYLAYALRFDFSVPEAHELERDEIVLWYIPFKLVLLYAFGQFSVLMTYFRVPDLLRISKAMGVAVAFLVLMWLIFEGDKLPPRGVILADFILSVGFLSFGRLALRRFREHFLSSPEAGAQGQSIALIVGTGETAESLVGALLAKPRLGVRPVGFLDFDPSRHGKEIHGLRVLGSPERLPQIVRNLCPDKLVLALPPSHKQQAAGIIEMARRLDLTVETVPTLEEIAGGRVQVTSLRAVEFEDLLGRVPARLDGAAILNLVKDKVVCVTGAGGSIGSELCRQIVRNSPKKLLLVDHSEAALFQIEQELIRSGHGACLRSCVLDVGAADPVQRLFAESRPQVLFHAAAYKHVPMLEHQPLQALRNNSIATAKLAHYASEFGVERFVLISTDKAINPTSVMGASKRLAECLVQSVQQRPNNHCQFVAVRFGNVLGSSGSVIPIFKRQIAEGGPVTVTHPEVTRYFMTIPEAVGLVLQSAVLGAGAQILVLDMGQPLKITDIARQLIRLSGLEAGVDIAIEYTGLRPGEKLFEELQHHGESFSQTEHEKIVRFEGTPLTYEQGQALLLDLEALLQQEGSTAQIKTRLRDFVPEYVPDL